MKREPVCVRGERVWRTYLGGREIGKIHGDEKAEDSHFPEEWMYSVTRAFNAGREEICEGLCKIAGGEYDGKTLKEYIESDSEGILGKKHVETWGSTPGVLIKMIDSKERLTVQVHPDRETAKRLFGSPFGKTECWHILNAREDCEEKPCLYLGFKEGITRKEWEECFFKQDYDRMLSLMNCLKVKPGETYLVKGGVPHAIGAGCTLIEIQEPTDYTIRVEKVTPSGYTIDDSMCHQGLGFEKMFECFHYVGAGETATREDACIRERALENGGLCLVGYEDTPCFKMQQHTIEKGETKEFKEEEVFSCLYILSGKGILKTETKEYQIERNSQFFVPAGDENYSVINTGETKIQLLKMYGPQE